MKRLLPAIAASIVLAACTFPEQGTLTPTPKPETATETASSFNPSIKITGDKEWVYQWSKDRCNEDELPDLPARAIRNADGMVELYISSTTNYRMIGADLDSLKNDCIPVLVSDKDRDPAHYSHSEWLAAPYTLDGHTVYAIVHQEYHGDQVGSIWQADGDFGSTQGTHDWYYQGWNGSAYADMHYDAAHRRWQGSQPLCQVAAQWMHPDLGCEPARTWVSPLTGTVTINGRVYDADPKGGNGVIARIFKENTQLWSATIENGDSQGQAYDLQVDVQKGDAIHFRVNSRGDTGFDSTFFNPGVNIGPAPCPSGRHSLCTMISLTYAVSTDGGKTFTQPPAPDHLLADLPYRYDPDAMRAIWQPSNIVKNPRDGYYYALVQRDEHLADNSTNLQGTCVMRTQTLDDPTSWRAWDGNGFDMRFIDPYVDTGADPAAHTCQVVSLDQVGALTYGLTYNTYFDKFIAVGVSVRPGPGFYYSLSDDLVHWTPKKLLMSAPQSATTGGQPPFYAYPTLIDPDSPSPSYDVSGQTPYLYYSHFIGNNPWSIDLMRVRVELQK
jgi:hypothetical protein